MKDNIYLELELFLDPPIVDPDSLKKELEQRISSWNKQVNANPKYKVKVAKARGYIKNGLGNLPKQSDEARKELLKKLRESITQLQLAGDIDETGLKHLNDRFKNSLTDMTIRKEVQDAGGKKSVFTPPDCPDSLRCEKTVSFGEMQKIQDDLSLVDGIWQSLYEFLELSHTSSLESLSNESKRKAEEVRTIPVKDIKADALNRLAGKALNYFPTDGSKTLAFRRLL